MYKYKKGVSYQFDVEGLGEFRFIFSRNLDITPGTDKYYMKSYWNPESYGLVDFIVGCYINDIEDEVKGLSHDLSYFVDGARISCICRIEDGSDNEGVYEGILNNYFGEEYVVKED
jgi:hypothetical protein